MMRYKGGDDKGRPKPQSVGMVTRPDRREVLLKYDQLMWIANARVNSRSWTFLNRSIAHY